MYYLLAFLFAAAIAFCVKLYRVRSLKRKLRKLIGVFKEGAQQIDPQIIVSRNSFTQYWLFKQFGITVCNTFDFRNLVSAEVEPSRDEYTLKLIPFNGNLIAQSDTTLTSQQDLDLYYKSYEKAVSAKNIISDHVNTLSKKRNKLNPKNIVSVNISFHKRDVRSISLSEEDIRKLVEQWNCGKESEDSRVFFDTIILVTLKNGLTRVFWRMNNTIFENYQRVTEANDLNFLNKYYNNPNDEFGNNSHIYANQNTFSLLK